MISSVRARGIALKASWDLLPELSDAPPHRIRAFLDSIVTELLAIICAEGSVKSQT
jgi:hypothetical protein